MTVLDNYVPTTTTGNGAVLTFTFNWKIFDETEIDVYLIDTGATTNKELQVITTDYTVAINTTSEGGVITFVTAPPTTKDVLLERSVDNAQTTDIPDVGSLNESQLEDTYDVSTMQIQQLAEQLGRTVTLSVQDNLLLSNFSTEITGITSGAVITVNGDATGFTTATLASLSAISYPITSGIAVATGNETFISRTLAAASAGDLTITDPSGVSGDPTFDLSPLKTKLASTSNGKGLSTLGFEDAAGASTATDGEAAIAELFVLTAGFGDAGVVTGSYTGDGQNNRTIDTGLAAGKVLKYVTVFKDVTGASNQLTWCGQSTYGLSHSGSNLQGVTLGTTTFQISGEDFIVGSAGSSNVNTVLYRWAAFYV